MNILPFNLFQQRVKKLDACPNHLNAAEVNEFFGKEYDQLTEDDLYPVHSVYKEFPFPKQHTFLYRVTSPFSGFDETFISYFQHPPPLHTGLGRCNLPKFPAFYCSEVAGISLLEVVAQKLPVNDSNYFISQWVVQEDRKWRTFVFLLGDLPDINPLKSIMDKERPRILVGFKGKLDDSETDSYVNFFNEEFTKDDNHVFSSLISHSFLYTHDATQRGDVILYPSVQNSRIGNNYAFRPVFIENGTIKLSKVYKIHITHMDSAGSNKYNYSGDLVSVGIPINKNSIAWNTPTSDDVDFYNQELTPTSP